MSVDTQTENEDSSPVYVAFYPDDILKSPNQLYASVKDVAKFITSPEGKNGRARFKRFGTPKEARDFLQAGDSLLSPCRAIDTSVLPAEPVSPFSSVSRIQMNEFKRCVDKGDIEGFQRLVDLNPRYIVNTGGDVAAIVMEGFRYNALHIAAKSGQTEIIRNILSLLHDTKFLMRVYGTNEPDVSARQPNVLVSYLNTPDKGNCDSPLHFASKFGHVDVVKCLAKEALLNRNIRNKAGKTALEVSCERYNGENKEDIKQQIELILQGFYVVLLRSSSDRASFLLTQNCPDSSTIDTFKNGTDTSPSAASSDTVYRVCAVAGPITSFEEAKRFRDNWKTAGKETKKADYEKGYEKVGRMLCDTFVSSKSVRQNRVAWRESWRFFEDAVPIDVCSHEGLHLLDQYLAERRRHNAMTSSTSDDVTEVTEIVTDTLRRKLKFDDDDSPEDSDSASDVAGDDDEIFFDATTEIEVSGDVASSSFSPDDSLLGLTELLAAVTLNSPLRQNTITPLSHVVKPVQDEDDMLFVTPPCTPPPTFLIDQLPSKTDNDLFEVLSKIPADTLSQYSMVSQFVDKIERMSSVVRSEWLGVDSPRRAIARTSRILKK